MRKAAEAWFAAIQEPEEAQERVLKRLTALYARTGYGREHGIQAGMSMEEFRRFVPPRRYEGFKPYVQEVLKGDPRALLADELVFLGITSGTTGRPKVVPITKADVALRAEVMATCLAGLASYWRLEGIFGSPCIAPCLPSRVSEVQVGGRAVPCGYISGVNAEITASYFGLEGFLRPYLERINEIGPGIGKEDWGKRFSALMEALEGRDAKMAIGAAPALWMFARWLRKERGRWPKDLWDIELLLVAGVPYIMSSYAPGLSKAYGEGALLAEAYGATEGMFAARLAEEPYLVPFYNAYLYEVRVGREVKMLYEMEAGEIGSIIISTPVFPRYEIGDLVLCHADGVFFSVPGRDRPLTRAKIKLGKLLDLLASPF